MRSCSLPIRLHGVDTSLSLSDSSTHQHSRPPAFFGGFSLGGRDIASSPSPHRLIRFTYKELQKATKNFTMIVGKGAFGPVYKGMLPNMAVVAVKVLATDSKQGYKEFQNEVILLGRLHHKNLLDLVGYCAEGGHCLLAYDYMRNGSLAGRLHDEHYEVLSWGQRITIAQDIARGIEYLHDGAFPPVIHRDIKSSNILLDSFMVAKVSDFGLSKEADSDIPVSGIRGTYGYVDPEYVSTNSLTNKSDMYSFGVLLFELIAARRPQEGLMDYIELANGRREVWLQFLDPRLKQDCNFKELIELVSIASKCVENEARKRPKIHEVVQALSRLGPESESARFDLRSPP